MAIYRRFLIDPGLAVLLAIESVNVIDLNPPSPIVQVGSGNVCIVGEFENGPFNSSTEVDSATDVANTFGLLGFTYGSVPAQYPCAVARKVDGALTPEYWNGNAFVQLSGKQFSALTVCRVDTSVGTVQFTRNAYVTGSAVSPSVTYALVAGQILALNLGQGSGSQSATFSATAASVTGAGATYAITAGQTATLAYTAPNGVLTQFTTTFQAGDTTVTAAVSRINLAAGFTFAANSAGQVALTSLSLGSAAEVSVISGTALTALGLTVANTFGTGNVANISSVTFNEIATIVQAAIANTLVERDPSGFLRISNTANGGVNAITVAAATTALNLGFVVGQQGSATGLATLTSTAGTYPVNMSSSTLTLAWDNSPNLVVSFVNNATTSLASIITQINAAAHAAGFPPSQSFADSPDNTLYLRLTGAVPGGKVTVVSATTGILTALGLTAGTQQGTANPTGKIPAGTVVAVTGGTKFVTMQDVTVIAPIFTSGTNPPNGAGPYPVKIRHAVDDGTGTSATAGTVTQVLFAPVIGAFACTNLLPTTNALSETQIDVAYATAMQATLNPSDVSKTINVIFSARQSNACRVNLKQNAIVASQGGMLGRMAVVRPPLGITTATALSTTTQPGVGAYRDQRVIYCFPGVASVVNAIAAVGTAGGQGFTATGQVDQGADGWLASILSNLPPEENPGQDTEFTTLAVSLESAYAAGGSMTSLQTSDYINFKAGGICAPIFDFSTGVMTFQSGITSVDPIANPGLVRIARRRMADLIEDSVAMKGPVVKKLSTDMRRRAYSSDVRQFFEQLLSRKAPEAARIAGYTLDVKQRNDPTSVGLGLYYLTWKVRTLSSLDSIVHVATVGDTVDVEEKLPQAA